MTQYVIGPSDPTHAALYMQEGDSLILMDGGTIRGTGFYDAIHAEGRNNLVIDGQVESMSWAGIISQGRVTIGETGTVVGAAGRPSGLGIFSIILNDMGPNYLNNAGYVRGTVLLYGTNNSVINSGKLEGGVCSAQFEAGNLAFCLDNTGTIKAMDLGFSVVGELDAPNVVNNQGHLEGIVRLGNKDDLYDGRGGTALGNIEIGRGDDVVFGGSGAETFSLALTIDGVPQSGIEAQNTFIDGGAGTDTIHVVIASTIDLSAKGRQVISNKSEAFILNVENLSGSNFGDNLTGTNHANVLVGAGGNDTLDGREGADVLTGGSGNDILLGGEGSDIAIFSGKFSDYIVKAGTGDFIQVTDTRVGVDSADKLYGIEFAVFADKLYTVSALPTSVDVAEPINLSDKSVILPAALASMATPLALKGSKKADVLRGGLGDDNLNGGLGRDKLSGGAGDDTFVFSTKLKQNVDTLLDFTSGQDTITLSKAIFSGLKTGHLDQNAFRLAKTAKDADDHILYDARTGKLFYDADGSGDEQAVQFAKLEVKAALSAADFIVV